MQTGRSLPRLGLADMQSIHRYAQGLVAPRSPHNPRALNLGLELLCNAFPVGALVVNSEYRPIFSNREAIELLGRWHAPESRARTNETPRLPQEIKSACERLRQGTSHGQGRPGRPHFGGRILVSHPVDRDLSAVVGLERSPRDRRVALFWVFLHDRLKQSVASGRRDQLAMLTTAERRVAKLAAEGLRNQEIAFALGKSLTTVKSQLASTFGKLGVSSRVQLAALLRSP